jgi:uncharacterized protein (TIGR02391 family)
VYSDKEKDNSDFLGDFYIMADMKNTVVSLIEEGEDLWTNYQHENYEEHIEDLYLDFTTKATLFFQKVKNDPLKLKESFGQIVIANFDLEQLDEVLVLLIKAKTYFDISDNYSFGDYIHPLVTKLSRDKFEKGFYADAVETALKEINNIVKKHYKSLSGIELDGAQLMHTVFSVNNPVFQFDDVTTETGRNIQQGYMQIFAGAMIGIRNPKAHNNMTPDENKAMHLLFIASFMTVKLEDLGLV